MLDVSSMYRNSARDLVRCRENVIIIEQRHLTTFLLSPSHPATRLYSGRVILLMVMWRRFQAHFQQSLSSMGTTEIAQ